MRFVIEHAFALAPAAYEALFFDESFSAALGEALGLGRELVKLERTEARIFRQVRCEPKRDPKSPAGQALGNSRASYLDEIDYDVASRRGAWRTVPNLLPDRVRTSGTLEIIDGPGGGARRTVRGTVEASLWGFGGLVERAVVAEIEKSYAGAARFTSEWIASIESPRRG